MSILCELFGHKWIAGKQRGREYFRVRPGGHDGTGRWHGDVHGGCDRCGENIRFGSIHIPNSETPVTDNWISVEDRLPENYKKVQTYSSHHRFGVSFCVNGVWKTDFQWRTLLAHVPGVTHWQPKPLPPVKK